MPRVKERAKKFGGGTTPLGTNQPGSSALGQAARSSKPQWRSFLCDLAAKNGRTALTFRKAWGALTQMYGDDVQGGDRYWVKEVVNDLVSAPYGHTLSSAVWTTLPVR